MGTMAPNTMEDLKTNGFENSQKELDAGAMFVLKSKGSWLHCGYHLTTSIVAPVLLSIPFALGLLGWVGGLICLTLAGLVTFYAYNLLSLVLEHHANQGHRQLRFRDMARDILGPKWGKYFVGPLQLGICFGAVIACTLLGGQSLKFIYLLSNPNGEMKLYQFIIMFGSVVLVLAQMPSFHSLRHINLISLILCLAFSACAAAGSVNIGHSKDAPRRDYSATIAAPVQGKMFKGLCVCYSVIAVTYFSVGVSGYWAFGNQAEGTVLSNFMGVDNKPLLPTWFLVITNVFTITQVLAVTLVYLQPTNEVFENKFADPKMEQFSTRNIIPRLIFRSLSVIVATLFAAMLPFFGDLMALFGAFGCIPLDFILPMIFYNVTFKPSKRGMVFWVNSVIVVASSVLVGIGAIASLRQIVIDAKTYRLFANM
ncbi:hypothetical protein F8388_002598 [Cannabis sativa]|uniref:Amino acid transporter transmembrane domain-containing protein n=1 Tax=Cannabis sativa TaxID=3483 RepID=A0A7J6I2N1_CANSA|nr:hypothetical protein F8388_002598 [Cannabis sativa]KAF4401301.1 hypothetical protein G4B88_014142 [Cannabis sativa]